MHDPRLDTLAEVTVRHCASVKRGDLVTIVAEPSLLPAVEAMFAAVLRAQAHPSFHPRTESLGELVLRHGNDEQIGHVCPFERFRLETCDVLIVLSGKVNARSPGRGNQHRAVMAQAARRGLLTMCLQRAASGSMRYVLTEIPTNAAAQDAQMSLMEYADWVYRAGFLHMPNPVGAWARLKEQQQRVAEYLRTKNVLRFCAPPGEHSEGGGRHDGTDLTVDVTGRAWVNCAGKENFPDGEVFSGPRRADGIVNFANPALYRGRRFDGVRLKFRDGRVVEASAATNEDHLIALLDQDAGARVMGEIAIGTNYQIKEFTQNAFFDEKIGGTFHLALGAGYPETGNCNESALHWDMVCDLRRGGTIHADRELVQQDGKFLFAGWPSVEGDNETVE